MGKYNFIVIYKCKNIDLHSFEVTSLIVSCKSSSLWLLYCSAVIVSHDAYYEKLAHTDFTTEQLEISFENFLYV